MLVNEQLTLRQMIPNKYEQATLKFKNQALQHCGQFSLKSFQIYIAEIFLKSIRNQGKVENDIFGS